MYQNRLAVAVKSSGKVLREFKDTVYVPFGTEYSVLIKNLHSLRVKVNVQIDGQDTTEGSGIIINGNSSLDLERFIKGGNLESGNRFKFIERTGKIEQHRGIGIEDGLIRIEFEFERESQPLKWPEYKPDPFTPWTPPSSPWFGPVIGQAQTADAKGYWLSQNSLDCMYSATATSAVNSEKLRGAEIVNQVNDAGITVPGSVSDQKFTTANFFYGDGVKHVMVLKLLGETEAGKKIEAPVTVKAKPKCVTCGKQNKATSKFCGECGTALEIL